MKRIQGIQTLWKKKDKLLFTTNSSETPLQPAVCIVDYGAQI